MLLIALTPEKEIYNGDIRSVKVPGTTGQFEILKGHAPIVASLKEGEVRIIDMEGNKSSINIMKGFVEVLNSEVSILIQSLAE